MIGPEILRALGRHERLGSQDDPAARSSVRPTSGQRPARASRSVVPTGLASSAARFQRRAQDVRRRPVRLLAYAAAVLVVLGLLVWLVAFSPVLAVRTVEVVGVPRSEVAPIRALARVPLGQPLARVDGAPSRPGWPNAPRSPMSRSSGRGRGRWSSTRAPGCRSSWSRTLKVN